MSRIRVAITAALSCLPLLSLASTSGIEMRDEVIQFVIDGDWSSHTCRRVIGLGRGTVSGEECAVKVVSANAKCLDLAKTTLPVVTNEEQTEFLVEILMTCPVAHVLGIGYIIDGKQIHIQWNELGG